MSGKVFRKLGLASLATSLAAGLVIEASMTLNAERIFAQKGSHPNLSGVAIGSVLALPITFVVIAVVGYPIYRIINHFRSDWWPPYVVIGAVVGAFVSFSIAAGTESEPRNPPPEFVATLLRGEGVTIEGAIVGSLGAAICWIVFSQTPRNQNA